MKRKITPVEQPPPEVLSSYEELKLPDGTVVGWVCVECGRLLTAPHLDNCSVGGKSERRNSDEKNPN